MVFVSMVFNSNMLVTVTERSANGTIVYDHVIEDKGRKIKAIFNILDGPRREQVLPADLDSQLESQVKHAAEEAEKIKSILDRLGHSVTYLESFLNVCGMVKDVSRPFQSGSSTDYKYCRRSTLSLAFPLKF